MQENWPKAESIRGLETALTIALVFLLLLICFVGATWFVYRLSGAYKRMRFSDLPVIKAIFR